MTMKADAETSTARAEPRDTQGRVSSRALVRLARRLAIQLWLVIFLGALITYVHGSRIGNSVAAQGAPATAPRPGPIVVQNAYYPKPGLEEDVFRLRLRASAVRAQMGLFEGRVLRRIEGPDGAAYVIWEAEYADSTAREQDVARLSTSAEFDSIQKQMGTLLLRFERSVWQVAPTARPR